MAVRVAEHRAVGAFRDQEALRALVERVRAEVSLSRRVLEASKNALTQTVAEAQASVVRLRVDYRRGGSLRSESQWLRGVPASRRRSTDQK